MNLSVIRAYVAGGVVCALVLWPVLWPFGKDSYPLSHYPMFAIGRTQPVLELEHVLAVSADGSRRPLPPSLTANGTVMQAAQTIALAVARGAAESYCTDTAARVRRSNLAAMELEVVTSRYHVIEYFTHGPTPLERRVHARCRVASDQPGAP